MPELPDITIYLEALAPRIVGQPLERARIVSPSLLRTVDPPLSAAEGRMVAGLRRLGKRIVWEMEGDIFLVFHLMIAGRFKWRPEGTKPPAKVGLASFDFPSARTIAGSPAFESKLPTRRNMKSRTMGIVLPHDKPNASARSGSASASGSAAYQYISGRL